MQYPVSRSSIPRPIRGLAAFGLLFLLAAGAAWADTPARAAERHTASVDVRNLLDFVVSVGAADPGEALAIDIVALDEEGHQHRRTRMQIEAGGRAVLGTDSLRGFDRLLLSADRPFEALLEDADSDFEARIESATGGATAGRAATKANQCDGAWNLSCIAPAGCTYTSGYLPGRVEPGGRVFWNLHTPDPSFPYYRTLANGCWANWYQIQSNGCPRFVDNCFGQTYEITTSLPTQGPDLVIRNLTLSPSSIQAGGQVGVFYDVVNEGDVTVTAAYRERIVLRAPGQAPITLFVTLDHGQDLPPGASYSGAATVQPPGGAGSYAIDVEADAAGVIAESNENNNVSTRPLTITSSSVQQLTIDGLTYRPQAGDHWQFSMHDCTQGALCVRSLVVRNTGTVSTPVTVVDDSGKGTTLTHDCPSSLQVEKSCTITAQHVLPVGTAREYSGSVKIFGYTVPDQFSYPICIADDNSLCR